MTAVAGGSVVETVSQFRPLFPTAPGGFVTIAPSTVAKVAKLPPRVFAVWAVLTLADRGTEFSRPRSWLADRVGAATADQVKKLPGQLRQLEALGLLSVAIEPTRVRVRMTPPRVRRSPGARGWQPLLRRADAARAGDLSDPVSWSTLQAWLRWQQVLRTDRVEVTQKQLAAMWGITDRTVRTELGRLVEAGWVSTLAPAMPGQIHVMRAAELEEADLVGVRALGGRRRERVRRRLEDPSAAVQRVSPVPVEAGSSGTVSRKNLAPRAPETPPSTRARFLPASGLPPMGTSVPPSPSQGEPGAAAAASRTTSRPHRTGARGDLAERQARRIVAGQRWLATAPQPVPHQVAMVIARRLREPLVAQMTPTRIAQALATVDPGEGTTEHCRLVRIALAGIVADAKASPHTTGTAATGWDDGVDHHTADVGDQVDPEILAAAQASLDSVLIEPATSSERAMGAPLTEAPTEPDWADPGAHDQAWAWTWWWLEQAAQKVPETPAAAARQLGSVLCQRRARSPLAETVAVCLNTFLTQLEKAAQLGVKPPTGIDGDALEQVTAPVHKLVPAAETATLEGPPSVEEGCRLRLLETVSSQAGGGASPRSEVRVRLRPARPQRAPPGGCPGHDPPKDLGLPAHQQGEQAPTSTPHNGRMRTHP